MKTKRLLSVGTAALSILLAAPAVGAQGRAAAEKARTVEGEVVEVRQSAQTANQGAFTEIKVRTRQQQESWFRLGAASRYGGRFQAGDRVRARILGGAADPGLVRTIHNQRTGEKLRVREANGTLIRERDRDRLRDGTGSGDRDRGRTGQRDRSGGSRRSPGGGGGRSGGGR